MNYQAIWGLKDNNRILEQVQRGDEVLLLVRETRTGDVGFVTVMAQ
jgi:hypothetical protein